MSQYVTTPDGQRHVFPDEATPEQIKAALSGRPMGTQFPTGQGQELRQTPGLAHRLFNRGVAALPSAGGLAGGLVGGAAGGFPGAVMGAGAGGVIGETAKAGISGQPFSEANLGGEALKQAGAEVVGQGIAKGLGAMARPIMKRALGPSKKIAKNFPDVVETALKEKIPVSKGGLAKAEGLRNESSRKLMEILGRAKAGGTRFTARDVSQGVDELINNPVIPNREKDRILASLQDFLNQHSAGLDPVTLKEMKRLYQNRASGTFRGLREGTMAEAEYPNAAFNLAIAQGAKNSLERIPGVAAQEGRTQSLIGATKAVEDATYRTPPLPDILKPTTWPVVGAVTSRNVQSRLAIALADPRVQELMRQSPRAAAELLNQLVYSDSPDGR